MGLVLELVLYVGLVVSKSMYWNWCILDTHMKIIIYSSSSGSSEYTYYVYAVNRQVCAVPY